MTVRTGPARPGKLTLITMVILVYMMTMVIYMSSEVDSGDDDDKHGDIHWAGHVYVTIHPITIETMLI